MTKTIAIQNKTTRAAWLSGFTLLLITLPILFVYGERVAWTRTYGGVGNERGYSVEQTSDNGYIIAGYTNSFGAGLKDIYLMKTNEKGRVLWTKTYGGSDDDLAYSVKQTSDNGYIIVGYTQSFGSGSADIYLVKTNNEGNVLWTKTYGGVHDDKGYSVQQMYDGGYIIVGYTCLCGAGVADVYIIRTDKEGDVVWAKTYGGMNDDRGYSIEQLSNRGYVIAGWTNSSGAGSYDAYVVRIDTLGNILWEKTYGGASFDAALSVQQTADRGFIIAGHTHSFSAGDADVYLIKTDEDGECLWTRVYGGYSDEGALAVRQISKRGYIIAGYTDSFGAGGWDFYCIRTDVNGDTLWTRTDGGPGYDAALSVQQTSDRGFIIAGYMSMYSCEHGEDVCLIKIASELEIVNETFMQDDCSITQIGSNLFNGQTVLSYNVPKNSSVRISIYNHLGQSIRTLVNQVDNQGAHTVSWDGRDDRRQKVPNGTYFLNINTGAYRATKKLVVIK